ncbi:hypothetical protein [Pseudoalteromonas luteoviolacea]|uniref:Uncharacterized protein n=1 Tax=Pseudoalteromonas luteoviolacea (strain 2ta16) TaxID=1353533 RepID=V4HJ32_PSEL2|nr:hypothetical protein [Pseudoalteromonas luteoviolacea]ESP90795.1 hypothetical protein PL2TA16_01899 [Pseudoalteromonas luteoviolacea 2ta16]KZN41630.1 hypothetical protein N483_13250 [Pseudoalteromonas luteoviolacea NCIMB 1944]
MFSYENFTALQEYYSIAVLPVYFIALFISWKNINFRYLISMLIAIELFDSATYLHIVPLGSVYYLWGAFVCALFIIPVMGRRLIAGKLESKFAFFKQAKESYHFTKQEGGLLFLYFLTAITFLITFVEISLYKIQLTSGVPFRIHMYGPFHTLISFFELFLVISMVVGNKTRQEEGHHNFA